MAGASLGAMLSSRILEWQVVGTPAISILSFTPSGMPCNGPSDRPATMSVSALRAVSSAPSASTRMKAPQSGLRTSVLLRAAALAPVRPAIAAAPHTPRRSRSGQPLQLRHRPLLMRIEGQGSVVPSMAGTSARSSAAARAASATQSGNSTSALWSSGRPCLRQCVRVRCAALPGHGRSSSPARRYFRPFPPAGPMIGAPAHAPSHRGDRRRHRRGLCGSPLPIARNVSTGFRSTREGRRAFCRCVVVAISCRSGSRGDACRNAPISDR